MKSLLCRNQLPEWFEYPQELVNLLKMNELDLGPWQILHDKWLDVRHAGLKERYPNLNLVPFARRLDDDDVACFDVSGNAVSPPVKIIHDFSSPGWEEREIFNGFGEWLQSAQLLAKDWD